MNSLSWRCSLLWNQTAGSANGDAISHSRRSIFLCPPYGHSTVSLKPIQVRNIDFRSLDTAYLNFRGSLYLYRLYWLTSHWPFKQFEWLTNQSTIDHSRVSVKEWIQEVLRNTCQLSKTVIWYFPAFWQLRGAIPKLCPRCAGGACIALQSHHTCHSQNIVLLITNKLQLKSSSLKSLSLFSRFSGNSSKCSFLHIFSKHSIIRFSWFIIPTFGVEWKNVQTFHFLTFWGKNKIQGLHGLYFSWTVVTPKLCRPKRFRK